MRMVPGNSIAPLLWEQQASSVACHQALGTTSALTSAALRLATLWLSLLRPGASLACDAEETRALLISGRASFDSKLPLGPGELSKSCGTLCIFM